MKAHHQAPIVGGTLYVVGTPIGNLEDITYRAVRVLSEVSLIAAEDTRSARVLLDRYEIHTPTISLFKGNEHQRIARLLDEMRQGHAVAVISESGMPGISDPGGMLICACREADLPIDVIPGPNAALCALLLSALPADQFIFAGFLPRQNRQRRALLDDLARQSATIILYEAPPRVAASLKELAALLGDRPAAVVREITKLHQETVRGSLLELADLYAEQAPRGEITLVIGPGPAQADHVPTDEELAAEISARLIRGETPRQIADQLNALGRRRIYQLALASRAKLIPPTAED